MADPENVADPSSEDVVITDAELYQSAISDTPPAPEPAPQAEAPAPEPAPQAPEERPRDEHGRFAPKPAQQATTQQPPQQPPQPQPQRQPEDHRVPLAELHRERERAQRAEAEANQMRQAWAQFQAQQQAYAQQQAAAAQQEQAPQQTIFDDPQQYILRNVIEPLRQEMEWREIRKTDKMSREFADREFGKQAVDVALNDLGRIRQTPHGDVIFRQIMDAGHPYGALVLWHKQAVEQYRMRQEFGSDPSAWKQKYAEHLRNDPAHQAEVLKAIRDQQQKGNGNRPPNVSLPPSLSSMPASSGRLEDQGDMSDQSLYRFATK